MGNLAGKTIYQSYKSLVTVGTSGTSGLSGALQPLTDGQGTELPIDVSTTEVHIKSNTLDAVSYSVDAYGQVIDDQGNWVGPTAGLSGTSGSSGTSGINGTSGTSGAAGAPGASGTSGTSGTRGTSGSSGTSGTSGANGAPGVNGTSGTSGTRGTSGSSGTSGTSGTRGTSGSSGTSGINGAPGVNGTSGTSGVNGAPGANGTSGSSGTSGAAGVNGTSGSSGTSGASGVDGANCLRWEYTGVPTNSGEFGANTLILSAITSLSINKTTDNGADAGTWLTSLNTRSVISITEVNNPTNFGLYQVTTSINNVGTWVNFDVTPITGNGIILSNSIYSICKSQNGSNGTSGSSGSSGTSGATGANGTSGSSGTSGIDGTSGTSGTSGADGAAGTSGSSGTSGATGAAGTGGSSGTSGTSGAGANPGVHGVLSNFTGITAGAISAQLTAAGRTAGATSADVISFIPFIPMKTFTAATMNFEITVVGTNKYRLCVYSANATTGAPETRLTYSNEIDSNVTGVRTYTIAGGFTFNAGTLYYLALQNPASGTQATVRLTSAASMMQIGHSAASSFNIYFQSPAGGPTLPPATASGTLISAAAPHIWMTV